MRVAAAGGKTAFRRERRKETTKSLRDRRKVGPGTPCNLIFGRTRTRSRVVSVLCSERCGDHTHTASSQDRMILLALCLGTELRPVSRFHGFVVPGSRTAPTALVRRFLSARRPRRRASSWRKRRSRGPTPCGPWARAWARVACTHPHLRVQARDSNSSSSKGGRRVQLAGGTRGGRRGGCFRR